MTRNDKILLIVSHCIIQEVEDSDQFAEYLSLILKYDDDDLNKQIKILENESTTK